MCLISFLIQSWYFFSSVVFPTFNTKIFPFKMIWDTKEKKDILKRRKVFYCTRKPQKFPLTYPFCTPLKIRTGNYQKHVLTKEDTEKNLFFGYSVICELHKFMVGKKLWHIVHSLVMKRNYITDLFKNVICLVMSAMKNNTLSMHFLFVGGKLCLSI